MICSQWFANCCLTCTTMNNAIPSNLFFFKIYTIIKQKITFSFSLANEKKSLGTVACETQKWSGYILWKEHLKPGRVFRLWEKKCMFLLACTKQWRVFSQWCCCTKLGGNHISTCEPVSIHSFSPTDRTKDQRCTLYTMFHNDWPSSSLLMRQFLILCAWERCDGNVRDTPLTSSVLRDHWCFGLYEAATWHVESGMCWERHIHATRRSGGVIRGYVYEKTIGKTRDKPVTRLPSWVGLGCDQCCTAIRSQLNAECDTHQSIMEQRNAEKNTGKATSIKKNENAFYKAMFTGISQSLKLRLCDVLQDPAKLSKLAVKSVIKLTSCCLWLLPAHTKIKHRGIFWC